MLALTDDCHMPFLIRPVEFTTSNLEHCWERAHTATPASARSRRREHKPLSRLRRREDILTSRKEPLDEGVDCCLVAQLPANASSAQPDAHCARIDILVAESAKPSSTVSSEREKARRSVKTSMLTHHGLGSNAQSLSMTPQQFSASTSGSFATPADEEATGHSIREQNLSRSTSTRGRAMQLCDAQWAEASDAREDHRQGQSRIYPATTSAADAQASAYTHLSHRPHPPPLWTHSGYARSSQRSRKTR